MINIVNDDNGDSLRFNLNVSVVDDDLQVFVLFLEVNAGIIVFFIPFLSNSKFHKQHVRV